MNKKRSFNKRLMMLMILTLIVGMMPQNVAWADNLPIDGIIINDFKIIDQKQNNIEIDYSYAMEQDPTKFANALCAGQINSSNKLKLDFTYNSATPFKEGDVLTIPAQMGSGYPFSELPLVDQNGNVLGKWHFNGGAFVIKFGGDFIKNHTVKQLNATMETGWFQTSIGNQPKTFNKGERIVKQGVIGNKPFTIAYEKYYIVAEYVTKSSQTVRKNATRVTDQQVKWYYALDNDFKSKIIDGKRTYFYTPYMYDNNGQYKTNSYTGIYIEDTIEDAVNVTVSNGFMGVSGINDDGKIISGRQGIALKFDQVLAKVDQAGRTRAQVKAALQDGQYCLYKNADGTTTVMIKYWDFNDSNGYTYNDVPAIKKAGGVGNYLKAKLPDIYGGLKDATIQKINDIYDGKAVQSISFVITAEYNPVNVPITRVNTAQITTDQTGTVDVTAKAKMTPPGGATGQPADPLAIKLLKTDKKTGAALSTGFDFALETSSDGGATWSEVTLTADMVEEGTLNADSTVTPNALGVVQVKKLTGGNKYRFIEKAHDAAYQDVVLDDANPNDKDHTTSANSQVVEVTNQGQGHLVVMYNEKKPTANYEEAYYKEDANGTVEWNGKKYSIVTNNSKTKNGLVGSAVTPDNTVNYPGYMAADITYQDSANTESTAALVIAADGTLVVRHYFDKLAPTEPKKEVFSGNNASNIDGQEVKPGDELAYVITYHNSTGLKQQVAITDTVPANTAFLAADNGGTEAGGVVTWNKMVADGEDFKVTLKVKVADDAHGVALKNSAEVKVGNDSYKTNETKNTTPVKVKVVEEFYREDATGTKAWDGKNYSIVPADTKTSMLAPNSDVTLETKSYPGFTASEITYTDSGNAESTTVLKVAADGTLVVRHYYAKIDPEAPLKEVFSGNSTANINGQPVSGGQELTYKISYKTVTGSAIGTTNGSIEIVLTDEVPNNTTYVNGSASDAGVFDAGKITWTKTVIAGQAIEVTFKVVVNADASGTVSNQAVVKDGASEWQSNETNNPVKPPEKYKAEHKFVSADGSALPQAVLDLLPPDMTGLTNGTTVTPTPTAQTEVVVTGGKWVFEGYTPQRAVVNGQDIVFSGTWKFVKDDNNNNNNNNNNNDDDDGYNGGGSGTDVTPAKIYKLGNYVWDDVNKNGLQEGTEGGVKGVTVALFDKDGTKLAETTTDVNGRYIFEGLGNGTYTVKFSNLPADYQATKSNAGDAAKDSDGLKPSVTIKGADNTTVDLGIVKLNSAIDTDGTTPTVSEVQPTKPTNPAVQTGQTGQNPTVQAVDQLPNTSETLPVLPIAAGLLLLMVGAVAFIWGKRTEA